MARNKREGGRAIQPHSMGNDHAAVTACRVDQVINAPAMSRLTELIMKDNGDRNGHPFFDEM